MNSEQIIRNIKLSMLSETSYEDVDIYKSLYKELENTFSDLNVYTYYNGMNNVNYYGKSKEEIVFEYDISYHGIQVHYYNAWSKFENKKYSLIYENIKEILKWYISHKFDLYCISISYDSVYFPNALIDKQIRNIKIAKCSSIKLEEPYLSIYNETVESIDRLNIYKCYENKLVYADAIGQIYFIYDNKYNKLELCPKNIWTVGKLQKKNKMNEMEAINFIGTLITFILELELERERTKDNTFNSVRDLFDNHLRRSEIKKCIGILDLKAKYL